MKCTIIIIELYYQPYYAVDHTPYLQVGTEEVVLQRLRVIPLCSPLGSQLTYSWATWS